jgi:hypothetical protein
MAIWSTLKEDLQRRLETTVRAARGNKAELTANERYTIFESLNEALQDICLERGFDGPKVIETDTTASTTADTNYVDLGAAVLNVRDGTVRIPAEDIILTRFGGGVQDFYAYDPGEDVSSTFPTMYCLGTNGSGAFRMHLRPIPDASYTIYMHVESMPDEDSFSTLPGWYHGALRSLATAIALESLHLPLGTHQMRYEERMKNLRAQARGFSGPQHITARRYYSRTVPAELRRPD